MKRNQTFLKRKRIIQSIVGITFSAFFGWLALRSVPVDEVVQVFDRVRPGWLAIAPVLFALGCACRIWRWRLMLIVINPDLTWGRCAVPFMASIAANNVLPFRAGDFIRAFGFSGWLGISSTGLLTTLLAERLIDLLTLICALALGLVILDVAGSVQEAIPGISSWGMLLASAVILLVLFTPKILEYLVHKVLLFLDPAIPRPVETIRRLTGQIFQTLYSVVDKARMPALLLWSVCGWALEGGVFYLVALSIPDLSNPVAAWLAMPIGTLSTMLPSAPGYVGTFHYFVTSATELFGNSAATAAVFALLVHLVLWIPATFWGLMSFLYWLLRRSRAATLPS